MHHEPIFNRPLQQLHDEIIEVSVGCAAIRRLGPPIEADTTKLPHRRETDGEPEHGGEQRTPLMGCVRVRSPDTAEHCS
jgi:hypothetical protein